jgi:hypothetical protein
MIKSSLEWEDKRAVLKQQIQTLPYNQQLRNMLRNIDGMITKLSNAEVNARRNRRDITKLSELQTVNDAIDILEKWIMMGAFYR